MATSGMLRGGSVLGFRVYLALRQMFLDKDKVQSEIPVESRELRR